MPPAFGDTAAALIVDDEPAMAELLSRLLHREGYHCTIAANAAVARQHLSEKSFAVALVDVMMPGESGLELVAFMLQQNLDIAAIMVSGVDHPSIAELASSSGAYGYLVKPFQLNQVLITVSNAGYRRCLEILRRRYESQLLGQLDQQAADLEGTRALLEASRRESPDLLDLEAAVDREEESLAAQQQFRALSDLVLDIANTASGLAENVARLTRPRSPAGSADFERNVKRISQRADEANELTKQIAGYFESISRP
jgi:DNA-binding NtrC family response regulator